MVDSYNSDQLKVDLHSLLSLASLLMLHFVTTL